MVLYDATAGILDRMLELGDNDFYFEEDEKAQKA
jgi:hypothetical protein